MNQTEKVIFEGKSFWSARPIQPLFEEDFRAIPFPDHIAGLRHFDAVNKKKVLPDLAAHARNPKHFRIVPESGPEKLLGTLWRRPSKLFPFSYR